MKFSNEFTGRQREITELVSSTFADSEGAEEGALIGGLAGALMRTTPEADIQVYTAEDGGRLIGAALFTRLRYDDDPRCVFLHSPMAVATDRQGEGVGQALLTHALGELKALGVEVAITYGDPNFYGRVGFAPLSEATAPAPLPLSYPEGWIGQSLTAAPLSPLRGASTCAEALNDPAYW